jgi:hypothetical protein
MRTARTIYRLSQHHDSSFLSLFLSSNSRATACAPMTEEGR